MNSEEVRPTQFPPPRFELNDFNSHQIRSNILMTIVALSS